MPVQPTHEQLDQLTQALLSAFDHAALTRLLRNQLDLDLEWVTPVAGRRDLTTVAENLVAWFAAQEGNGLQRLLAAALAANPQNQQLGDLSDAWAGIDFTPLPLPQTHPSIQVEERGVAVSGDMVDSSIITGDISITDGDFVGRDKIIHNLEIIHQQALSAIDEMEKAQLLADNQIAVGVQHYVQQLRSTASSAEDAAHGGPYRGLAAYQLSDAELFYGRVKAISELLQHMQRNRLTVVHSESGAGKTSLIRAGIAPRILSSGHLPLVLRPYDADPAVKIKQAFVPDLTQFVHLQQAPLQAFLRQVCQILGIDTTLYIFLDQFEEYFTAYTLQAGSTFVNELATCLEDEGLNVRWTLALRSEFFSDLDSFRPRIRNPFENDYRLYPMTRAEAQTIITEPAAQNHLVFEGTLVEEILNDLSDSTMDKASYPPAQIQLVCSALYEMAAQRVTGIGASITASEKDYQKAGRARGILRGHLNRVLAQTLPTRRQRDMARQLLVALVSSEQRRIRRTRSELARTIATYLVIAQSIDEFLADVSPVLNQLVENRLLSVEKDEIEDEEAYELAHDYLVSEVQIDPEIQAQKAAQELLNQEVSAYRQFQTLLSPEKYKIIDSQHRFLVFDDQAKKLFAQSRAHITRRQRILRSLIALAFILISSAAALFLWQRNQIAQERNVAISRQLAADSVTNLQIDPELSILLALEAYRTSPTKESIGSLHKAVAASRIRLTLDAHVGQATVVVYSPDGTLLASGGGDGKIKIWDPLSGQTRHTLSGHDGPVSGLQFDASGERFFSVGTDGKMVIWESETGNLLDERQLHQSAIRTLALSPTENKLATAGVDGKVHVWDAATWVEELILTEHTSYVTDIVFSPDGLWLASASLDGRVLLWDVHSGELLYELPEAAKVSVLGHQSHVNGVNFVDIETVASVGWDGKIILWDVSTGVRVGDLLAHGGEILDLTITPDEERIATAGEDKIVNIWNSRFTLERSLYGHRENINKLAFSPDGLQLATASADGKVRIWNAVYSEEVHTLIGHTEPIQRVALSNDGLLIATGSDDGTIRLWDFDAGQTVQVLAPPDQELPDITAILFANNAQILSTSGDGSIHRWNLSDGHLVSSFDAEKIGWAYDADFNSQTDELALGNLDGELILMDMQSGEVLKRVSHHNGALWDVDFSPDFRQLVTAGADKVVLWEAETLQVIQEFTEHSNAVRDAAFSPDGQLLVTGGEDGKVWLRNLEAGDAALINEGHTDRVTSVAFSPDGTLIASSSSDALTQVWSVTEQRTILSLSGHLAGITDNLFSHDNRFLLTTSVDKTVQIYALEPNELMERYAAPKTTRTFTEAECLKYLNKSCRL